MSAKPMKLPSPDHPITIEPNPRRIVISIAGRVIADSRAALTLREASYPAVQYIRRCCNGRITAPIVRTRAIAPISVSRSEGRARRTRCGPTRDRLRLSLTSKTTLPSIPIASTRSKSNPDRGIRGIRVPKFSASGRLARTQLIATPLPDEQGRDE
jgi:hypothetical protein